MNVLGVIPARFKSSRFPGKPLALIHGKTMIQRVYEQAFKASSLSHIIVATDDELILNHVLGFGGHVVMTSESHNSGTERCLEVVNHLSDTSDFDVIVNIQGDEPLIDPEQIDKVSSVFLNPDTQIATLAKIIQNKDDIESPNIVKLVIDKNNRALYFSRYPVPYIRNIKDTYHNYYKHIGIYGFRKHILKEICLLKPSKLEIAESLEQLRWLENAYRISVSFTDTESLSVDIPEDIFKVETYLKKQNL